jgi:hypothetical protein
LRAIYGIRDSLKEFQNTTALFVLATPTLTKKFKEGVKQELANRFPEAAADK